MQIGTSSMKLSAALHEMWKLTLNSDVPKQDTQITTDPVWGCFKVKPLASCIQPGKPGRSGSGGQWAWTTDQRPPGRMIMLMKCPRLWTDKTFICYFASLARTSVTDSWGIWRGRCYNITTKDKLTEPWPLTYGFFFQMIVPVWGYLSWEYVHN